MGEWFRSRGIGLDRCRCFVCGDDRRGEATCGNPFVVHNIAAYVNDKGAGERVVEMFGGGARLDYREHEPNYVQVKVGACDLHLPNLQCLHELCKDGRITPELITEAIRSGV